MTWEVFSLRCRQYGGVRFVGRGMLVGLLLISFAICLFLLRQELQANTANGYGFVARVTKRVLDGELSGFLILTECVFSMLWKPSVPRNILWYGRVFTAYMFLNSMLYLLNNLLNGAFGGTFNLALQILPSVFCIALILGVTREGEGFDREGPPPGGQVDSLEIETGALLRFLRDLKSTSLRPR